MRCRVLQLHSNDVDRYHTSWAEALAQTVCHQHKHKPTTTKDGHVDTTACGLAQHLQLRRQPKNNISQQILLPLASTLSNM